MVIPGAPKAEPELSSGAGDTAVPDIALVAMAPDQARRTSGELLMLVSTTKHLIELSTIVR